MSGAKFLDSRMLNQPRDPALVQRIQILYEFVFQFQEILPKLYIFHRFRIVVMNYFDDKKFECGVFLKDLAPL